jgi:hypothetical protein
MEQPSFAVGCGHGKDSDWGFSPETGLIWSPGVTHVLDLADDWAGVKRATLVFMIIWHGNK